LVNLRIKKQKIENSAFPSRSLGMRKMKTGNQKIGKEKRMELCEYVE